MLKVKHVLKCSPECTANKCRGQRVLLLCSAGWHPGCRIEAPGINILFIYLAPPGTGALVPGSEMIVCPSAGRWVVSVAQNIPCVPLLRVEQTSVPFCRVWGRGSLLSFHQQDIRKYFFRVACFCFPLRVVKE